MPVTPPVSAPAAPPETNSLDKVRKTSTTLDKDGFLKLFVAQLQHQDPTAPMDSGESVQQMSSFSMVEQITNMATQQANSSAVALIGRTVSYVDADKVTQTGTVESVSTKEGKSTLTIAGKAGIDPTSITQVA